MKELIRKERNTIKILSVGRFTYQKDYYTALKTISLLQNKCGDRIIEYTIIGDGELEQQIHTWIADLNVANVKVVKLPENIGTFFEDADIYFLSSLFEGLPNTIMEAMNYSLPVVSTDVSDVGYLVKEGINGFLSPAGDYNMLSDRLYLLVIDPAKRNEFGLQGHRILVKEFSENKYQDTYINFANELLSK
jgi:glycosyltransferase involved in cell wall biosynthesis